MFYVQIVKSPYLYFYKTREQTFKGVIPIKIL